MRSFPGRSSASCGRTVDRVHQGEVCARIGERKLCAIAHTGLNQPPFLYKPVADVTQDPIEPGESFTYEFAVEEEGTYFYQSYKEPAEGRVRAEVADRYRPAVVLLNRRLVTDEDRTR